MKNKSNTKTGRPAKFNTPEELEAKIEEYFIKCPDKRKIGTDAGLLDIPTPTLSGLALYLGFADRHSLFDYEQRKEFSNTIKRARARISQVYENLTHSSNCTGAIFMLKNLGFSDKQEIEHSGEVKFTQMTPVKIGGKKLEVDIG